MTKLPAKIPWGLVAFVVQAVFVALLWLHGVKVKAEVNDQLKDYAPVELVRAKEAAQQLFNAEVVRRLDSKLDDVLDRVKRIEALQMESVRQ